MNRTTKLPDRATGLAVDQHDVLVLALDAHHPSGQLLEALVDGGVRPIVVHAEGAAELPDPGLVRAAVMVGSARFDDAEAAGGVGSQIDWLHKAEQAGTPVLALGHGARLLAVAFGGRVMPADRPLRGWTVVDTQSPHLIPAGPWLTWQHELIWLGAGAEVLAHNRLGPQVFRIGRHLGVQFHPDATRQTALSWPQPSDLLTAPTDLFDVVTRDLAAATSSSRRVFATFLQCLTNTN